MRRAGCCPPSARAAAGWPSSRWTVEAARPPSSADSAGLADRGGAAPAAHGRRRAGPGADAGGRPGAGDGRRGARLILPACRSVDETARWRWPRGSAAGRGRRSSTCCSTAWPTAVHAPAVDRAGQRGRRRLIAGPRPGRRLQRLPREVEALNLDRADASVRRLAELRPPPSASEPPDADRQPRQPARAAVRRGPRRGHRPGARGGRRR